MYNSTIASKLKRIKKIKFIQSLFLFFLLFTLINFHFTISVQGQEEGQEEPIPEEEPPAPEGMSSPPAPSTFQPPKPLIGHGLEEAAGKLPRTDIPTLIGNIVKVALGFVGIIFMILLTYGGFMWMTAGGNEEQLTKAKKLITQATIGLIIVIGAYAVTYFVTSTLLGAVGQ